MILILLIVLLVVAISGYTLQTVVKPKNFPPGPKWYPFVGCSNLVQNMTKKHGSQWKALSALAKDYSTEVLGLKLGNEMVVVVYGIRNIHRVFTEKEFEGRPNSFFIRLRCFGKRIGITSSDGVLWKEHRQFTLKHLRNVGFGKTSMEKEIQNEMCEVVEYIKHHNDKPISPKNLFATAVMNVLWKYVADVMQMRIFSCSDVNLTTNTDNFNSHGYTSTRSKVFTAANVEKFLNDAPDAKYLVTKAILIFGISGACRRQELANINVSHIVTHGDLLLVKIPDTKTKIPQTFTINGERIKEERLKLLLDLLSARSKAFSMSGGWLNQMPWIRFFFPEMSGYSLITKVNEQLSDIIEEAIRKHKNNIITENDYIYSFMNEMKRNRDTYTEEQLKVICLDLLIAGSQTTSNVLEFAFLVILRNKVLQEKIYDEISTVLGREMPCWADNSRLVYTSAFILEVHRYYTIVPLVGPRRVLSDTMIENYLLRKDTTILISVGDLHFDAQLWDDPQEFKPERFIDERGMLKNVDHLYPFGLGRRRCPGDSLAKSFIFIFFVGILQQFKIECSNGVLPSSEPFIGLISSPRPYIADFIGRNK